MKESKSKKEDGWVSADSLPDLDAPSVRMAREASEDILNWGKKKEDWVYRDRWTRLWESK